ncbi:MAG TPA: glycosyltransferase family 39 protein [Thermoanaerobaculia bacterium]
MTANSETAWPQSRRRTDAAALVGAWAILVAVALALRPILPIDETRYVTVAWEMWQRGDFLVPHLNGLPYSEKPPLLFWLMHFGWWMFGVNDWWPRLVPALFGLANLFLTASLARRLWPDRPEVARTAPAVLLGLLLWSLFTAMIMFDMLVAFCVLLAIRGIHDAWTRGGARPWLMTGVALGLGVLAKGPVALLLPLLIALSSPWWGGRLPRRAGAGRRWLGLAGAVGLAAVIAFAWALPAAASGGSAYADAILLKQTEARVVRSFAHRQPWWWYLPLLPVLLSPYSLWPPLWKAARRELSRQIDPGLRLCLAWFVPGFVAFSLISGKQPHYLIPLCPAFALLAARLLDEPVPVRRWHLVPAAAMLLIVGGAMALGPLLSRRMDLPEWAALVAPGVGVVLLAATAGFFFGFRRLFVGRPAALTLLSLALVAAAHAGFAEVAERAYDLRPVSRYLGVLERQGRPIAWVGHYHGQFHFLGRLQRPFHQIEPGAERLWLLSHPRGKVIQDLRYAPPEISRADYVQPYRDDTLAVWGYDAVVPPS